ncbi:fimbrial protein [Budvicia diplopodorum]|uniref:fimbrial protein n=1 Tax=Budvicia diplopodorum TaxID=1119056 RepID=UPI00135703AA|nr:fimbrial protein [Budvicia diplopodorum]
MKKNIIASALLACAVLSGSAVAAGDGSVNFAGAILESACTVQSTSQNLNVNLGKIAKGVFAAAGNTSTPMPFSLKLDNCPAAVSASGVSVRFEGTTAAGTNNILSIAAGGAVGVGVQMKDSLGNIVVLGSDTIAKPLVVGSNSLDFTAYYISTSATVTAGAANSMANFTLVYP